MQELSSRSAGHEFTVDGVKYFLPPLSIRDVATVQEFAALPPLEQASGMADLLASRAVTQHGPVMRWLLRQKSPQAAVAALGVKQQSALFTEWASAGGIKSGESSSSDS